MAKNERLNEEAAQNNNIPPSATSEDIIFLNELNDKDKKLPKAKKPSLG